MIVNLTKFVFFVWAEDNFFNVLFIIKSENLNQTQKHGVRAIVRAGAEP